MNDHDRGREWVRRYPEVAQPLVFDKDPFAYIARLYPYALPLPDDQVNDDFLDGALDEAKRDPWWERDAP